MRERWFITGAAGQLGGHVLTQLRREPHASEVVAGVRTATVPPEGDSERIVDLADAASLRRLVRELRPTHILHLAAMTAVADAFARPKEADQVNHVATAALADVAQELGARLVFSSTDMVFDGSGAPYDEGSPTGPLTHYARTKVAAEVALAGRQRVLVVRVPLMYGSPATRRETTFTRQLAALRSGARLTLFDDEYRTPVSLADAARAMIGLARSDLDGLIHVAGPERLSRLELVMRCAELLGVPTASAVPVSRLSTTGDEPRPADLSLDGGRLARGFPDLRPGPLRREVLTQ